MFNIGTLQIHCPHSKPAMKTFISDTQATANGDYNGDHNDDQKSSESLGSNNAYCSWSGTINVYISSHSAKCQFIGVCCPLHSIGCTAEPMIQQDLPQHFAHCNMDHLTIIAQQMELMQIQQLQFQQYMKSTDSKLQTLSEAVDRKNALIDRLHTKLIGLDQDRLDEILEDLDPDTLRLTPPDVQSVNVQSTKLLNDANEHISDSKISKTMKIRNASKSTKTSKSSTKSTKSLDTNLTPNGSILGSSLVSSSTSSSGSTNLVQSETNGFDQSGASSHSTSHSLTNSNSSSTTLYGIGYNYGGELGVKREGVVSSWTKLPVSEFGAIKKVRSRSKREHPLIAGRRSFGFVSSTVCT